MSSGRRPLQPPAAASAAAVALFALLLVGCATSAPPPRSSIIEVGGRPQEGQASWYGREQHGGPTASGQRFDMYALTAAHRTLPMGTRVRVTSVHTGRSVVVRINDRGPYSTKRIIDLSYAAAKELGILDAGVVPVRVEVVGHP